MERHRRWQARGWKEVRTGGGTDSRHGREALVHTTEASFPWETRTLKRQLLSWTETHVCQQTTIHGIFTLSSTASKHTTTCPDRTQEWLSRKSTCCVQLCGPEFKSQNSHEVKCGCIVCNPSESPVRCEQRQEDSWELTGQSAWHAEQWTETYLVSNKVNDEEQRPRLTSDTHAHTCIWNTYIHITHTHIHLYT